ncbi:hypothetical protein LTR62_005910 [Meristemomyces frigidus]|uniref:Ubiquitin-like protease family profile domain-containing protein n=1 Tax=Meristemomyces frigidus TaxID=1508187 RepID=A0AAN7YS18_9PEZI|nr:hypothetical protein LTR62_005910 [Meristemomyces frigidus]
MSSDDSSHKLDAEDMVLDNSGYKLEVEQVNNPICNQEMPDAPAVRAEHISYGRWRAQQDARAAPAARASAERARKVERATPVTFPARLAGTEVERAAPVTFPVLSGAAKHRLATKVERAAPAILSTRPRASLRRLVILSPSKRIPLFKNPAPGMAEGRQKRTYETFCEGDVPATKSATSMIGSWIQWLQGFTVRPVPVSPNKRRSIEHRIPGYYPGSPAPPTPKVTSLSAACGNTSPLTTPPTPPSSRPSSSHEEQKPVSESQKPTMKSKKRTMKSQKPAMESPLSSEGSSSPPQQEAQIAPVANNATTTKQQSSLELPLSPERSSSPPQLKALDAPIASTASTAITTQPQPALARKAATTLQQSSKPSIYASTTAERIEKYNKEVWAERKAEKEAVEAARKAQEKEDARDPVIASMIYKRKDKILSQKKQQQAKKDADIGRLVKAAKDVMNGTLDSRTFFELSRKYDARKQKEKTRLERLELEALNEAKDEVNKIYADRHAQMLQEELEAAQAQAKQQELQKAASLQQQAERERQEAEEAAYEAKQAEEAAQIKKAQQEVDRALASQQLLQEAQPVFIRPLPIQWATKLNTAMSSTSYHHKIATSMDGTDLTKRDFLTLLAESEDSNSDSWLNDEIVNAWLSLIVTRKHEQSGYVKSAKNVPNFIAFNSAWYSTVKSKGMDGIAKWSRRKGIKGDKLLTAEKIFFPINTGSHWMMMIISPTERKIDFLDSMSTSLNSSGRKQFLGLAREWLALELGKAYRAEEWTESPALSSQQTNSNDCGVFSCFNALASGLGLEYGEVDAADMQLGRRVIGAALMGYAGVLDF